MKVVVTGSQGFIGKNLCIHLQEQQHNVLEIHRETPQTVIISYLKEADFIFHLAGTNRPINKKEFQIDNIDLTEFIVKNLKNLNRNVPIAFTSSTQVEIDNDYGMSKLAAEKIVQSYSASTGANFYIYRLPNVFGKWCKPNYNSFVATFCNNILKGLDITINDPKMPIKLVYIDDVCSAFLKILIDRPQSGFKEVPMVHDTTVGDVADILTSFKLNETELITERVGEGLRRALYSTYLSYKSPEQFHYSIPSHKDNRGVFTEMLKTMDSGQFSFFTAHPGITRGGHYHHSKNEKFLVIKGDAVFKFQNILTDERYEITVSSSNLCIVETVPGWSHDITNTGKEELIVMLWANEIFDPNKPDTVTREIF